MTRILPVFFVCSALFSGALAADFDVTATIKGDLPPALNDELAALLAVDDAGNGYTSIAPLRRAAGVDSREIKAALTSLGYYAAEVETDISRTRNDVEVTYTVRPGPQFVVTAHKIEYTDEQLVSRPATMTDAGIETTDAATGEAIRAAEEQLLAYLRNNGFPRAVSAGRKAEANFGDGTAAAVYPIRTGAFATVGDVEFGGLDKTRKKHLLALRDFTPGAPMALKDLEAYQAALSETGIFSDVSVEPGETNDDGTTPVVVNVTERKRRTVGAGVSFGTDVGVGTSAYWEDRNFRGGADTLGTELSISGPIQSFELSYDKPVPRLPGSWTLASILRNEDTDAFNAQTARINWGISQTLARRDLTLNANVQYTLSDITDNDGTKERFSSASFPLAAIYDSQDSTLNPTKGHKLSLQVTPFVGSTSFGQAELGGASRLGFGGNNRFMIAARGKVGSSFGLGDNDVPATERFFAGGGGSVRGYAFQVAGPLSDDGAPTGGASAAEINVETRYKIGDALQLAAFADAGSVFDSALPDFSGDIPVGAGVGVRYLTPIGPIRFDVAVPINRRTVTSTESGVEETVFEDDPFQIYIAIGQPF